MIDKTNVEKKLIKWVECNSLDELNQNGLTQKSILQEIQLALKKDLNWID